MTSPTPTLRNRIWKTILPVGGIVTIVVVALWIVRGQIGPSAKPAAQPATPMKIQTGAVVSDFSLHRLGDGTIQLSQIKAKVLLINFWATWCEACMVEMPSIRNLWERFKGQGFEVAAISLDEDPQAIPATVKRLKLEFPVYTDPQSSIAELFDVQAIPLTVIIDRNRRILFVENGERDWNSEEIVSQVGQWLSG